MLELNVSDVLEKLRDLECYSPSLAQAMEHEEELPCDAVPFLVNKIEQAWLACERATEANRGEANQELYFWLVKSYRYYLTRLAKAENPWIFTFPKAQRRALRAMH